MVRRVLCAGLLFVCGCQGIADVRVPTNPGERHAGVPLPTDGVWLSSEEIAALPTQGPAWNDLLAEASQPAGTPLVSDQNDRTHLTVLAKALVGARTDDAALRDEVRSACVAAIGTEAGGRTLALGRNLAAYVIAADLVGLLPDQDATFRAWLQRCLSEPLDGGTLRSTHEERPNNWGTHAGASRIAVAMYLGDRAELTRAAQVFHGWLGDRTAYASFHFGDLSWQADALQPVGINPRGALRDGHPIDGVLPDDQRRSGPFAWPPPHENYVYEALQGALVQAVLLDRAGYHDVWQWQDAALLRAYTWLVGSAAFTASGDDVWQLPVVDRVYGTHLWDGTPVRPGKNVGWTDWTHGSTP
jgi:hypothetical protein